MAFGPTIGQGATPNMNMFNSGYMGMMAGGPGFFGSPMGCGPTNAPGALIPANTGNMGMVGAGPGFVGFPMSLGALMGPEATPNMNMANTGTMGMMAGGPGFFGCPMGCGPNYAVTNIYNQPTILAIQG